MSTDYWQIYNPQGTMSGGNIENVNNKEKTDLERVIEYTNRTIEKGRKINNEYVTELLRNFIKENE